jgi:hypothetical protein
MDHLKYQELNTLSVYEELKSDEQSGLIHHLVVCPECYADFEEKIKLKETLSEHGFKQPGVALLNQARRELRIALENDFKKKFITKMVDALGSFFRSNYKMILAGAVMVLVGLIAGKYIFSSNTFYKDKIYLDAKSDSFLQDNTQITNVKFADNIAAGGEVEFSFDAVKPVHIKGDINDPKIQNILSYAMVNGNNAGVRLNSINLINSNTSGIIDKDVRNAMINVIRNDLNPGVRREALKLMKKFPYDDEIKKTLLYVLQFDKDTSMRIESINLLMEAQKEGHTFNNEDLNIFREKLKQDNNLYIQYRVKSVLKEKA